MPRKRIRQNPDALDTDTLDESIGALVERDREIQHQIDQANNLVSQLEAEQATIRQLLRDSRAVRSGRDGRGRG